MWFGWERLAKLGENGLDRRIGFEKRRFIGVFEFCLLPEKRF
jgi:hypothetical protein